VESEHGKFRAQDLAEAVHLSQSALSRLVDRLARHGLVERCGCEGDRRGVYVVLTEAGQQRHAEAVPTHRGILARLLPPSMLATAGNRLGECSPGGRWHMVGASEMRQRAAHMPRDVLGEQDEQCLTGRPH
jgi:DNA-binding MarR family transcriptional regulator